MANQPKEDTGIYHLAVGTEVSAKYRGAFCEAQIKSIKKNVIYKVYCKRIGKSSNVCEENIKGTLKIGSVVEAQLPEQGGWQECLIQGAKDRSSYTVVFDDGDERTLPRGSLCLKGDRHYAKSETLDNLPLTDPENFGTPVLANKKNRSRRRPMQDEYDDESEDQNTPERGKRSCKGKERKQQNEEEEEGESSEEEEEEESDDEKRTRWLADPHMGKVVIVEPNDKRKHWFPGLVVNPLCYEGHHNLSSNQLIVRSFKTGKFLRVSRQTVRDMTTSSTPSKMDSGWKDIVQSVQEWRESRQVPNQWRIDIKDILSDSEEDSSEDEDCKKKQKDGKKTEKRVESKDDLKEKEEEKKNHDFLEILYKFMDDRGTPINKTPVLGYKDLNLYLLYRLVEKRNGFNAIAAIKDWKQIYIDLGIPKPNPAAGYNVKTAYTKYLACFEEYCLSWKHLPLVKKTRRSRSPAQATPPEDRKKTPAAKRKDESQAGKFKKEEGGKDSQEHRKIKNKEKKDALAKGKNAESGADIKTRGRSSPIDPFIDDLPQLRRSGGRRRISESSSASDVTTSSNGKKETPQRMEGKSSKGSLPRTKSDVKSEEKLRNPGGPDSEPDESSKLKTGERKDLVDKKSGKVVVDNNSLKRIRRNSTSNLSPQYVPGNKLKVKYGHGKTFKLYEAKVLQVNPPENPGDPTEYLVHYAGWNSRHDELIRLNRIVGLVEEGSPVPKSPTASCKSLNRRPKTPNSTLPRTHPNSREITPSSRVSMQLSKFSYPHDEESQSKTRKETSLKETTDHSCLNRLKKDLWKDFAESSRMLEDQESKFERPVSPVLMSAQRSKRTRSPHPTASDSPSHSLPAVVNISDQEIKQEESQPKEDKSPVVETEVQQDPEWKLDKLKDDEDIRESLNESLLKQENEMSDELVDDKVIHNSEIKKENDQVIEDDYPEADITVLSAPEEDGREIKIKIEQEVVADSNLIRDDSSTGDSNKASEDSSNAVSYSRRTSGRRSKSPAYLSDSSLYGLTKGKRNGSSAENSPSPTTATVDPVPEEDPEDWSAVTLLEGQDDPCTNDRSPSPSLSSSSASSNLADDSKEKSPVLSNSPSKIATNDTKENKIKRKVRRESGQEKEEEAIKKKVPRLTEESKTIKADEDSQTSEYDNFDEEAPRIALEKTKKTLVKDDSEIPGKDEDVQSEDSIESTTHEDSKKEPQKAEDEDAKSSTRRKVIKRKNITKGNTSESKSNQDEDTPELKRSKDSQVGQDEQECKKEERKTRDDTEIKPPRRVSRRRWASFSTQETNMPNEQSNSSNHDVYPEPPPPPPHGMSNLPQNAPSSSQVLLDNTPPTTPERSPTYMSEDQDHEKHSPLDSDLMDIGDEHKDSSSSTSSSGSGCEQHHSSEAEAEKMGELEEGEKLAGEVLDQEASSPTSNKKSRGGRNKRRRTTSKGNGHNYENDPDTESEDEADDEAGEKNGRKRNESGSRCKPRKKRAKARPEPPSAPPPLHCEELASMSQDERIALLQSRMAEMRKVYHQLKQEVANIDRKRRKAKRREREAAEATHLSHNGKGGMSPYTPTKAASSNGKADSGISSPKQAPSIRDGKSAEDSR